MSEHEQLMDNLLNVDLEIIDVVRELQQGNWESDSHKKQVGDLLQIRDEMVQKLMAATGANANTQCDCGHDHHHE